MRKRVEVFGTEHLERLRRELAEESYTLIQTSHSIRIQYGDRRILITDNQLSIRSLGLMLSLKKEVRERLSDLELVDAKARYFSFRDREIIAGTHGFEYDLDAAYLNELYRLGACSEALMRKLLTLEKKERLAVVGSLATMKITQTIEKGEIVGEPVRERDPELMRVWNTIVYRTDKRMMEYFETYQQVLWYWVDALFSKIPCRVEHASENRFEIEARCGGLIRLSDGRTFQINQKGTGI